MDESLKELIEIVLAKPIPEHVALIMDGNRRWAKKHGLASMQGHHEGAKRISDIIETAANLNIKVITAYAFSTENWRRSQEEINFLIKLLKLYLVSKKALMRKNGIRLHVIGDISAFSDDVKELLQKTLKDTEKGHKLDFVLAINYGGRDEIKRAIGKILDDYDKKKIVKEQVTEELIREYLDTYRWKDPDLIIRTSAERRLSNFLLWQSSYSEFYTSEVLWPDFTRKHFIEAIVDFQNRKRKHGE
jgi:undecaprenyl diphosphate synthase